MCVCSPQTSMQMVFATDDYISGEQFTVMKCQRCGTGFTAPVPPPHNWDKYYPDSYYGDVNNRRFPQLVEAAQKALYSSRVRATQEMTQGQPGRVLDVGCGRGHLLKSFRDEGWEVLGTEISERAAQFPRERLKLPVAVGDLPQLKLAADQFDAVVLWHVLEHINDPLATLHQIHRILRPGGVLLVGVPNFGSLEARLTRDKWFHLDVPRHLNHFTPSGLIAALRQTCFDTKRVSYSAPEYDLFSALQSLLNRAGLSPNYLYNFLRKSGAKTARKRNSTILQVIAHLLLLPAASPIAVALAVLTPFFHCGATQAVWATKTSGHTPGTAT